MGYVQVVKLPAHVSPAGSFLDATVTVEVVESGIAIGLQDAVEAAQVLAWMFASAIRGEAEPHRRWCLVARRPVIAHIGPQTSGFGLPRSGSQHRKRRVVGVYLL